MVHFLKRGIFVYHGDNRSGLKSLPIESIVEDIENSVNDKGSL